MTLDECHAFSTGAAVTTIDSFQDEAESEAVFHAGVEKCGLPIKLIKMKALEALKMLIESPPEQPFDFVFIDADKTEQIQYYELLMANPQVWGAGPAPVSLCACVCVHVHEFVCVLDEPINPCRQHFADCTCGTQGKASTMVFDNTLWRIPKL